MPVWRSANVLENTPGGKRLWQLSAESGGRFASQKDTILLAGEAAPAAAVSKDWQELVRAKLNIAWLPLDKVFLRAVQLPTSDLAEVRSMIELQLEKLSPLPVTHIVWSIHLLPKAEDKPEALQTVIVIIALRSFVEEFLGALEGIGFQADRLECPALEELLAANLNQDGVWIFAPENDAPALVAWRQGGTLQNLTLVALPSGPERAQQLKSQIEQIAWAAELEGWLTGQPEVHLIAKPAEAAYWEPILREWAERAIDVRPPVGASKLAEASAARGAADNPPSNLLPPEFATRYRQEFVDGLWMRGAFVVVGLILAGTLAYFGALYSLRLGLQNESSKLAAVKQAYLDSQKDKAEIDILQARADLQYAALDAWKAVAESMPEGLTLDDMYFRAGKLELRGTADKDDLQAIYAFNEALRHATKNGKDEPLFTTVDSIKSVTQGDKINWNFTSSTRDLGENE